MAQTTYIHGVDADFAKTFVDEWQDAWNAHDLSRLLTHYREDVVFQSPYIVHRFGDPTGEVRGKVALGVYWESGLAQQPDLHFDVENVRQSVDTLVINYRNQRAHQISEVLRFADGLVIWGCGAYAMGDAQEATRDLTR